MDQILPILLLVSSLASNSASVVVTASASGEKGKEKNSFGYGEYCNGRDLKCNRGAWLSCQGNYCDCIKPNEMIYEETVQSCVSKAGERCTFALDELQPQKGRNRKLEEPKDGGLVFEVAGCVPNAFCSPEGVCLCNNRSYLSSFDGSCTPARGHKDHCDSDLKCSQAQALHCHDGLCQCDEAVSVFEEDVEGLGQGQGQGQGQRHGQCVGLASHICINNRCTAHATCSTSDNLCTCLPDFYPDEESNRCLPRMSILENCTAHYQCRKQYGVQLLCLDGLCSCNPSISMYATAQATIKPSRPEDDSKFHGFTGPLHTQCVGLAGSNCIERLCAPNAYCSYTDSQLISVKDHQKQDHQNDQGFPYTENHDLIAYEGVCKCNKEAGYTESLSGFCGRAYAESCAPYTCIENLVCIDKFCSCPHDTQTYDSATKTCVSLVGGPCNATFSCGKKAECRVFSSEGGRGQPSMIGHCTCHEGYVEFPNGEFCLAGHETSCESSAECDSVAPLQCIDGMCRCGKFSEYNATLRKCVGLVGAKCDVSVGNECTGHAHCASINLKLPGSCVCDAGFFETRNYTCRSK